MGAPFAVYSLQTSDMAGSGDRFGGPCLAPITNQFALGSLGPASKENETFEDA